MSGSKLIAVYLQDHHAGATGGLELARRAAKANEGSEYEGELKAIADEIAEDVRSLERIMDELDVSRDRRKDGLAWVGERAGRLKRNGTWLAYSPLSRMVELEGLLLGVSGKLALWEALRDTLGGFPAGVDLQALADRAGSQRARLEVLRRRAAAEAFSSS